MCPPATRAMRHIVAAETGPVVELIADTLRQCHSRYSPHELLALGAVYHRPSSKKVHPVRVLDPALVVHKGEYVRVHPDPRRYEAASRQDWRSRVAFECDDFLVIDKPAGVPTVAALDNLHENVLSSLRRSCNLSAAWAPHRLDVDTSGLLVVAKTHAFCRQFGLVLRGSVPLAGKATKIYRALVATEETIDGTNSTGWGGGGGGGGSGSGGMGPLRVGQTLVHYQLPSSSSPKIFTSQPYVPVAPGGGRVTPGTDPSGADAEHDDDGDGAGEASNIGTTSSSSSSGSGASKQCVSRVVALSQPLTRSRAHWAALGRAAGGEGSHLALATSAWMAAATSTSTSSSTSGGSSSSSSHVGFSSDSSVTLQEVTLELVTGRTHQARGQLQALGSGCHSHYHICGDNNYTGCTSLRPQPCGASQQQQEHQQEHQQEQQQREGDRSSPFLALQAASLEFWIDPLVADRATRGGRRGAGRRRSSSSSSSSLSSVSSVASASSSSASASATAAASGDASVRCYAFKLDAAFWTPLLR